MSLNLLKSLEFSSWAPEMSQSLREDAIQHLESGGVLYLPHLGYALNQDQQKFLSPSWSDGKAKNISLRPNKNAPGDTFKGAQGTPEQLSALQAILIDYRSQACNLIQQSCLGTWNI